jgi:hypothetical protein
VNEPNLDPHLTDEQFTELLLGAVPPSVAAHLECCAVCKREAAQISTAIGSFEAESRLWAERRAATRPALQPTHMPGWAASWLPRPAALATAVVIVAVVIVGAFGISHRIAKPTAAPAEGSGQAVVSEVQPIQPVPTSTLQADNELLSAIDGELRWNDQSPATVYGLKSETHAAQARHAAEVSN